MVETSIEIRRARPVEASALATMMVEGLDSRLSNLGPRFVELLHQHMIGSKFCCYLVAELGGSIVGYAAALTSTRRFYGDFLLRKGLRCTAVILPYLFRLHNVHTALRGLTYSRRAPQNDPEAELVSFVVSPQAQNRGVGSALFSRIVTELRDRGIDEFKIDTSTENAQANAFYAKHGCRHLRVERFYQDSEINVYLKDVSARRATRGGESDLLDTPQS